MSDLKEYVNQILVEETDAQLKNDILFLLSFVPALNKDAVIPDLCATFYFTGSFNGDLELVSKIENIVNRYGVDVDEVDDVEDFSW